MHALTHCSAQIWSNWITRFIRTLDESHTSGSFLDTATNWVLWLIGGHLPLDALNFYWAERKILSKFIARYINTFWGMQIGVLCQAPILVAHIFLFQNEGWATSILEPNVPWQQFKAMLDLRASGYKKVLYDPMVGELAGLLIQPPVQCRNPQTP